MSSMSEADVVELYRDVSTYNSAFSHDASDSMQFMGQGEIPPPASCFICGTGNCEAGYLNTGIWADFIGNLLICAMCLVKGAEKGGCLAPSVKVLFEDAIEKLQESHKELTNELSLANAQLAAYRTLMPAFDGSVSPVRVSGSGPSKAKSGEGSVNPKPAEPTKSNKPKRIADATAINRETLKDESSTSIL